MARKTRAKTAAAAPAPELSTEAAPPAPPVTPPVTPPPAALESESPRWRDRTPEQKQAWYSDRNR